MGIESRSNDDRNENDVLISVLIPVYNCGQFLERCFRSLDEQTSSAFNVIVIDDGSTDESPEICDRWASSRENVAVIHRENCGLFATRREAISLVETEYFICLDSDDELFPTAIENIQKEILSHSVDVVDIGRTTSLEQAESHIIGTLEPGYYPCERMSHIRRELCSGRNNCFPGRAIRTSLYRLSTDLNTEMNLTMGEDWIQSVAIAGLANSFTVLPGSGYFYRQVPTSSSHAYRRAYVRDSIAAYNLVKAMVSKWGTDYVERVDNAELMLLFGYYQVMFREVPSIAYRKEAEWFTSEVYRAGLFEIVPKGVLQRVRMSVFRMNMKKQYCVGRLISKSYQLLSALAM